MKKKKRGAKIEGGFVPMEHRLLGSETYQSLSSTAKVAFMYFRRDRKNGHQTEVVLTLSQAKKYGVCSSPSTFNKVKRELVEKGFIDPLKPGGLNQPAVFELSDRWKLYGTDRFQKIEFKSGVGSKYFRQAWNDEKRSEKLIEARYGKKLNTVFI